MVKNLPAKQETPVRSLGQEDPLEGSMATPAVFLPGESPWTEEPGRLQSIRLQRVGHNCSIIYGKSFPLPSLTPFLKVS